MDINHITTFIQKTHIPFLSDKSLSPLSLQDRADRAARYAKTQEEEKAAKQALLQARQAEQEVRKEALVRERR